MKPAFWEDADLANLSVTARLTYVGLWCVADDAGWLEGDVAAIGHDLYGYENRGSRERLVGKMLAELEAAGRVIRHPCGHLEIPTLPVHQRLAAPTKRVLTTWNAHLRRCAKAPEPPAETRGDARGPDDAPRDPAETRVSPTRNGKERERNGKGYGTERNGTVTRARDDLKGHDEAAPASEFQARLAAAGLESRP